MLLGAEAPDDSGTYAQNTRESMCVDHVVCTSTDVFCSIYTFVAHATNVHCDHERAPRSRGGCSTTTACERARARVRSFTVMCAMCCDVRERARARERCAFAYAASQPAHTTITTMMISTQQHYTPPSVYTPHTSQQHQQHTTTTTAAAAIVGFRGGEARHNAATEHTQHTAQQRRRQRKGGGALFCTHFLTHSLPYLRYSTTLIRSLSLSRLLVRKQ